MERLTFLDRRIPPAFALRELTLAPGGSHPYDEEEWRDALVVLVEGELHVECTRGGIRRFEPGAVMWLEGLPLRTFHNRGTEPVLLVAITRRAAPSSAGASSGSRASWPGASAPGR